MAEFTQNTESKRFLRVVDELIARRIVDNAATFCRQVNFDNKSFSHIKTGKRNVPIELIGKLYTIFAGNPIFIVSGKGSLLIDDHEPGAQVVQEPSVSYQSNPEEVKRLNSVIDSMVSNAQVNMKYVKSLEEKIRRLEADLSHLQKGSKV